MNWLSVTYPAWMCNTPVLWLWKKLFCKHGWHLFDETWNIEEHTLYCDACDLTVVIKEITQESE